MRHLTLSRAVALAAAILLVPLPAAGPATAGDRAPVIDLGR
jgi:hypothetical protein